MKLNSILCGDAIEEMKKMPLNSIDTIITDPPYGIGFMGKEWDNFKPSKIDEAMAKDKRPHTKIASQRRSNTAGTYDFSPRGLKGFEKWCREWATEALRVAKPGATLLCFGGTRTHHRLACAIEDAGWILKDCIIWLYGQGFPKATDISKQIDKGAGKRGKIIKIRTDGNKGGGAKTYDDDNYIWDKPFEEREPATPEAKLWNGWKSHGLKPAYEPIIVAMKPNEGSYAQNALKYGVAGLNIEESRIGTEKVNVHDAPKGTFAGGEQGRGSIKNYRNHQGRYPSNIILDKEAAKMLDEQSGESKSSKVGFKKIGWKHSGNTKEEMTDLEYQQEFSDKGGASRFFKVIK